ncbi:MAG TPA: DUF4124 domain-containing protein [Thiobacillaceae bacterium]|nr:DUF4124 domain-containing protein [Thiobacillaceae bacterium]
MLQHTWRQAGTSLACGILLCLSWSSTSQAEIYKFVDDNGMVTYTNMPRPGVKPQAVIPDVPTTGGPRARTATTGPRKPVVRGSPAYFPRVDMGTQRKRDDMRRQLLEEERGSEERNLSAARAALAQGSRQPGADLRRLRDAVRMHEKNIEMLNKELSHIR